jgi:hypothetical protein
MAGRDLENWYGELNSSAASRGELMGAIIREGALTIEIWNGSDWQYGGFVWEVGPSLSKDLAVAVDLKNIGEDTLKVRLGSTAGLWMINSVKVDYTAHEATVMTEISPESAVTQTGTDVSHLLAREDHEYYVMPTMQDRAELIFTAPARSAGLDRTIMLKTSGYYKLHITPEGDPRPELLTRLLTEPGAISSFSTKLVNEWTAKAVADLRR